MNKKTPVKQVTSVASMAIYLVIVGGILTIPFAFIGIAFSNNVGRETGLGQFIFWLTICVWSFTIYLMWAYFVREGKKWNEPKLNTKEFFYFEISTILVVIVFTALLSSVPNDIPTFVDSIRILFSIILLAFNIAYFTLTWGMKYTMRLRSAHKMQQLSHRTIL